MATKRNANDNTAQKMKMRSLAWNEFLNKQLEKEKLIKSLKPIAKEAGLAQMYGDIDKFQKYSNEYRMVNMKIAFAISHIETLFINIAQLPEYQSNIHLN